MFPKKYTQKGKIIIGIYLISLVTIVIISSSYILGYMDDQTDQSSPIANETPSSETNSINQNEVIPSSVESTQTDNALTSEAEIPDSDNIDESNAFDSDISENQGVDNENGTYSQESLKVLNDAYITIYFDFQSFKISDDGDEALVSFANLAKQHPEESIVIEGYCDGYPNFANTAMEVELSLNRINAIYSALVDKGIDHSKLITVNKGSSDPVSRQNESRYKNDRVEIYFNEHVTNNINGK